MGRNASCILGISYGHGDSSAALIKEGELVAAVEEERFTRVKHYALFPRAGIRYCLEQAGLQASDVDTIAIAKKPLNSLYHRTRLALRFPQLFAAKTNEDPSQSVQLKDELDRLDLGKAQTVRFEHHLAHMASVRVLSDLSQIALLSFDGLGDFVSTMIGCSQQDQIKVLDRVHYPHSLGYFYTALTQFLGFPYFGDEFKVMGLSSYGKPTYQTQVQSLVKLVEPFGFEIDLRAFPVRKTSASFHVTNEQPNVLPLFDEGYLAEKLKCSPRLSTEPLEQKHRDLAKSVQLVFENMANELLIQLSKQVQSTTVGLSGGCAHNSVWVGKIAQSTPFKEILVAPASHDAGIAVGAAILAAGTCQSSEPGWALLGPTPTPTPRHPVKTVHGTHSQPFSSDLELANWMVSRLIRGEIVGLCRGRMEFGPRALGSRSILCSPRYAAMKERLNARVKHREAFRPFAASVLWEYQQEWFEQSFFSPNMEAVFEVRAEKVQQIAAVAHVDHSCRIQSVTRDRQPFFWLLIDCFRKQTGIPMLLNTSFNDCEPIVLSEQDAIRCFENCEMDHLVIENVSFSRSRTTSNRKASVHQKPSPCAPSTP